MNITAETHGHAVILNLEGELNEDSISAFNGAVNHYYTERDAVDLVLNLSKVPFVDSTALERLLELQENLRDGLGRLKLVKCDENVRTILELTRLDGVLSVFDDVPEAVKDGQS
ncbi:MAG: STAS domain-containing protein [Phycisphaerae bacterium]